METGRTGNRRISGIVGVVAVLMAAAFLVISLMVVRVEVSSAVSQAEETTELLSSALALEFESGNVPRGTLADTLATFGFDRGVDAVVFESDGTILASTTPDLKAGTDAFEVLPFSATHLVEELQHDGSRHLSSWQGLKGLLPHDQSLLDLRYSKALDAYLLIRNTAEGTFADMRETVAAVALGLAVVMTLLLLLVMFIVRTYRARLIEVATTDELTQLSNRRSFTASFARRAEAGTLVGATATLVDVDFFKKVNDTYGHAAGDEALAAVAAELRRMAGEEGLAGRWGGDEFIAVVCTDEDDALRRIQDTIDRIAALELSSGARISVSVGAATIPEGCTLEGVVERCDDALYVTKLGGRGFLTVYEPGVTPHMAFEGDAAAPQAAQAQSATATTAQAEHTSDTSASDARQRVVRRTRRTADVIVTSLFEAVTKMVPFVAAGGILIAIAFLVDGMSVNLEALTPQERANFGSITPLAASLKDVGSAAYNFMLPIFAAFFARGLGREEAFMAGFAGGYLASLSSAGFLGAIFCAVISAVVCNLMRGIIEESPKTVQRVAPILIYPLFSLTIMYIVLRLVLEPITGVIDTALTSMLMMLKGTGNQEVLGAALGAMMATDMGGPINKCAYHFGLAAIESGAYQTMAQVMIAGMVPPCGIALAMLAYPSRFDRAERDRGPATLIMGLGFITEGAIPFVITDPIRVIGASMVGSAVAAVASSLLGCTLMAPHGGIFVFPVVGNPLGYILALIGGSAVSALILGITRPSRMSE